MNRLIRLPLAGAACILIFGCRGDTVSPKVDSPSYAVSDGAHNGNPDFFFLPPLFKNPNTDANFEPTAANMSLKPAVEICELGAAAADGSRQCIAGAPLKRFDPSVVTASVADQQYQVNWKTDDSHLDPAKYYRIRVLVGAALLGFADIDAVSSGSQLKNVQTNEYIALLDGRTLPIKFRIESGALCAVDGTPCASKTIDLSQGGEIELLGAGEDFKVDIPSGTTATFNGQAVTNVTVNLEVCSGIDVDLPTFGPCLRLSTYFDATGGGELEFSNPVLISMCVLNAVYYTPDETRQQDLITLHQQDGSLIRALPHAEPNCSVIGSNTTGWGWLKSLAARFLAPQPVYAAGRNALLHVGAGGETTVTGSTCTTSSPTVPGLMLSTICPPSSPVARSGPQRSAMATVTPPQTVSDFQFALPAKMDYLNSDDASRSAPAGSILPTAVKVTDWDGNAVQGARVTFTEPAIEGLPTILGTAISNADGVAQISWTIRAGPNTAVASGRGIAAQNNYPDATVKPFMPDISQPTNLQSPVALGTGRVTFSATGVLMGSLSFLQQPTNTVNGTAVTPALRIGVFDPSGNPVSEFVRVTVGNDPANPPECVVLQTSILAIEGVAVLDNVRVNGVCTGARIAVRAGGGTYEYPLIFSTPFDIIAATSSLDQQNLLDGSIGGQGIGRFSDLDGTPDPDGTSFDFQDAQTFTVGVTGRLAQIKVPVVNLGGATAGVTMQVVALLADGSPDETHSFGEVTIPASAISTTFNDVFNSEAWATFDLTSLGINVTQGQELGFFLRSLSTSDYIYNPEFSSGYANGRGYRRNRALGTAWINTEADFGFQTFVIPN